jgi:hypothetical protein
MWPPPTMLGPAGAGGGAFQSRTGAAVLPAPPQPPPAPLVPPPVTQPATTPEPRWVAEPKWPTQPERPAEPHRPTWLTEPERPAVDLPKAAPLSPAAGTSSQYGDWARRQRPQGTVYGGAPPAQDPAQLSGRPLGFDPGRPAGPGTAPFEPTGSLSGHLLAQGRSDDRDDDEGGGSKVVMIILIVMSALVVGGLALGIAYLSGVFH